MRSGPEVQRHTIEALLDTLRRLPDAGAEIMEHEPERNSARLDALISMRIGPTALRLAVEAKGRVFTRDAEAVAWRIQRFTGGRDHADVSTVGLVAAETISPGARKLLQEEGIGYFETGGTLFLSAGPVFVLVDRPPTKAAARAIVSLFRGSRAEVLHALFERRDHWLGATELAAAAGVSPATASESLTELGRRGWVESRGAGPAKERRLSKPGDLLDAWADAARRAPPPRRSRRLFVPGRGEIGTRFAEACTAAGVPYAFTGLFAAQRYTPYLTAVPQLACWVAPGFEEALSRLGAQTADEGWNLAVQEAPSDGVFRRAVSLDGLRFASPLQVYLDLQRGAGRSKEMAEHLRRERLGP